MSPQVTSALRDRRRAETMREIKEAALGQLGEGGPDAMTLRAIAREIGVSVQALYHYVDSREALLTALIADAYNGMADAVEEGGHSATGSQAPVIPAGLAYRAWALDNRSAYSLTLGAPLHGYSAPEDGPTAKAGVRLGAAFRQVVFGDWSRDELAGVPLPLAATRLTRELSSFAQQGLDLPPGAFALFTEGWATLHGYVSLEVHGHLPWVGEGGAEMCSVMLTNYVAALQRARTAGSGSIDLTG